MLKRISIPAGTAALAATLVAIAGNVLAHEHPDLDGKRSFEPGEVLTPAFGWDKELAHSQPALLPTAETLMENASVPDEAPSFDVAASSWKGALASGAEDSPAGPDPEGAAFHEAPGSEKASEGSREEAGVQGENDASGKGRAGGGERVHLADAGRFQSVLQASRRLRFSGADLCASLCLSVSFHSAGLYALQGRQRREGEEAVPRFVLDSANPSPLMSLGGQELRDLRLTLGLRNKVRTSLSLKSDRIRVKFYMKFNMF